MKLIAEINEKNVEIEIVRDGEKVFATVDGRKYELEVTAPEPDVLLMKNEGSIVEAKVSSGSKGTYSIGLGAVDHEVTIIDPKKLRTGVEGGDLSSGPAQIKTAMPGKVVKILVGAGADINKGEGVIVVEAMKMQNELKAPRTGVVSTIKVNEGDAVAAGDVLATIE